jgi:hypothetical protein
MAWELGDCATLGEVKRTLDPSGNMGSGNDDFLYDCIHDASKTIVDYCHRWFYAKTETRYFHYDEDVDHESSELILDADLLSVDSITIDNGNTTLQASDFVLYPRNSSPKSIIKMKQSSVYSWSYQTDPEDAVAVIGSWGYNTGSVPINPIRRACVYLVEWMYHERKNPMTGIVVMPNQGGLTIPVDMPSKVTSILDRYVRPRMEVFD